MNPAVPSTAAGFGEFGSFNPGAGFGAPFNPMQVPPTALRCVGAVGGGGSAGCRRAHAGLDGRAPPTQLGRLTTSRMTTARMMTAAQGPAGEARPMTSVHGAGYNVRACPPILPPGDYAAASGLIFLPQSAARQPKRPFDPLNQGGRGPAPPLAKKSDNSPEDQAAEMEKQVNRLIEQSADAAARGDYAVALERAKEAVRGAAVRSPAGSARTDAARGCRERRSGSCASIVSNSTWWTKSIWTSPTRCASTSRMR